jgi:hypothetical protein
MSMSDSIRLSSVAIDCPDAGELAAFYAGITGRDGDVRQRRLGHRGRAGRPDRLPPTPAGHVFRLTTWDDVPS